MAEPLKNQFGLAIPRKIAGMIEAVYPQFDALAFIHDVGTDYDKLELIQRGWKIARTLQRYLPGNYVEAAEIIIASLGPKLEKTDDNGMVPFLYLPHVFWVSEFGLDHFEISMRAQYELTQRFTAEFSIRPFLIKYPSATLARLKIWALDSSPHVRRLVSEGTRPRLPWAPRLRAFQMDPIPVLTLLEILKDDPELYVRRSVANNLNDIGKDHPELLAATVERWKSNAGKDRLWLIRHALRSAVKRGEKRALEILGYGKTAKVLIQDVDMTPLHPLIGDSITIAFTITNELSQTQSVLVDVIIHFIKANGSATPKVFKIREIDLDPHSSITLIKRFHSRK